LSKNFSNQNKRVVFQIKKVFISSAYLTKMKQKNQRKSKTTCLKRYQEHQLPSSTTQRQIGNKIHTQTHTHTLKPKHAHNITASEHLAITTTKIKKTRLLIVEFTSKPKR